MAFRIADLYAEFRAKGLTQLSTSMGVLRGKLVGLSTSMSKVARGVQIGMIAVTGGLGAGAWQAIKFEKEMAMVSTMLDETSMQMMPQFTKGIRDLSKEFGESTETLAKGLYDILSAAVAPEKAMEVLATASKAAIGGFTSTAVAASAIITVLNSYIMSADQAGIVSDKLFAAVKRGVLTYEEMASSIGKASATAAIAGVSLDELLASIATITRAGISSDQAMTSVVGMIQSFLKPADEGAELAKQFGFELDTATLKAGGLAGVFKKLAGATAEQLATIFPNIRGLKGVAAAMQDQAGFATDLSLVINAAGESERAFGKAANTTAHQLSILKYTFLDLLRSIGEGLLPEIQRLAEWMKKLINRVSEWIAKNRPLITSITKIVVLTVGAAAALVIAVKAVGAVVAVFGLFKAAILVAVAALKVVFSALMLLLSPIGLVVAAVAALATYFLVSSGAMGKAIAWLKDRFAELSDFASRSFKAIMDALAAGDIGLAADVFWTTLKLAWQTGVAALKGQWLDWKQSFLDAATDAFYGVMVLSVQFSAKLKAIWAEVMDTMKTTGTVATGLIALATNKVAQATGKITEKQYEDNRKLIVKSTDTNLADIEKRKALRLKMAEIDQRYLLKQASEEAAEARRGHAKRSAEERAGIEKDLARARTAWNKATEDAADAGLRAYRQRPPGPDYGPPGIPGAPKAPEVPEPKISLTLDRGSWMGLSEVWKNIQSAIMGKDPQSETKKQTPILEDIRDGIKGLVPFGGAATVAEGGT